MLLSRKKCLILYHLNGAKNNLIIPIRTIRKKIDLQQRLEKKIIDVDNFNNRINNIKEMITYFKYKNHNPKKR